MPLARIATFKASRNATAALIEVGGRTLEVRHAELTTYNTGAKLKARLLGLALAAGVEVPALFVHINRDGSLALATGKEPRVWPEDDTTPKQK